MGNYASCTLGKKGGGGGGVKVAFPGGEIRSFDGAVKVAELMLELPNFFVVNSRSLKIGRRFAAMSADEDLEMGEVYVMVPMQRLDAAVRASDMGALFMAVNSAAKKKKKKASNGENMIRVAPEAAEQGAVGGAQLAAEMKELCSPELLHRRSMCRSRRQMLETIVEEAVSTV